ncbi:MAG: hypothetical protein AABZ53_11240 [Planctomycetota bacterium]
MTAVPSRKIDFPESHAQELEAEASRLNLSVPAYVRYLQERQRADLAPERFDRMIGEVFGRFGKAMRKLAQ